MSLLDKIFGSYSSRELKKIKPLVDKIESLSPEFEAMSDAQLKAKTGEFKSRLAGGESLDDILPEAFAAIREASWRVLGMKPFRVQLIGGIVLHGGRIAEMKTGEGKTLVAVAPAYLNALAGEGVHIVTVNDYLARRDSEWMGKVFRFMGLSVGLIVHGLSGEERKRAYLADITYGTNNEMGFDYLRDNMAIYKSEMVQRGHSYAIVDEVDSILIDEARTPLIISGRAEESTDIYRNVNDFVSRLKRIVYASVDEKQEEDENLDADYIVDEKAKTATLTARGITKAEEYFGIENLSDLENSTLAHHISQGIKAHGVMKRDIDYVVKDGEVIIVDEFTGRLMLGRRYSEGLHQAIEAKERVDVAGENRTLATITFQNYFRMYDKLSGMTGTAATEQEEFVAIYGLDIIEIPTNKPLARIDRPDVVFKNENGKNRAIIKQIEECHAKGQPVLVGTVSIEKSEYISKLLSKTGIKHNVLNAKNHEREAEIVAQAGKPFAVTIATNMAGRGTDIMLGGNAEYLAKNDLRKAGYSEEIIAEATGFADTENEQILSARSLYAEKYAEHKKETDAEAEKVRASGGLFILGTERHESRRIDNQLRGRAGRQGDPGESRFYIALTDDIMRLFGSERIMNMMETLGMEEDMPLDNKMLSNAIETAQKNVESRNFQVRKNTIEYDDVMNLQRKLIYEQRGTVLNGENVSGSIAGMIDEFIRDTVGSVPPASAGELEELLEPFSGLFMPKNYLSFTPGMGCDEIISAAKDAAKRVYEAKELEFGMGPNGEPAMREIERVILLGVVDEFWMDHIDAMAELRRGVGLRGYGNIKPIDAYKQEGLDMFETMVGGIRQEVVKRIFRVRIRRDSEVKRRRVSKADTANVGGDASVKKQPVKKAQKIGRNDPCPCGKLRPNGLPMKYKDCCGRNEQ